MNAINTAFQAVDNDDLYLLKEILQVGEISPDTMDKHGESLLHVSAGYGYLEIVQFLGEMNADLRIKDKHGDTPLYWASRHAHLNVVGWLLQHPSVSVNSKDKAGTLCRVSSGGDISRYDGQTRRVSPPRVCRVWVLRNCPGDRGRHCPGKLYDSIHYTSQSEYT